MPVKLSTASSGSVTLDAANTASNFTISVPAITATMAINGPAFSAYQSSIQTLSSSTETKILYQTELFDTNNNFASSRFTPTVAGYYQITGSLAAGASRNDLQVIIYKNGVSSLYGSSSNAGVNGVTGLVYLNGSTDYVEIYGFFSSGQATFANQAYTYFQGVLVRAG